MYRNDTIRNCLILNNYIYFKYGLYENVVIHNNIFSNSYITSNNVSTNLSGVDLRNNIFLNRNSNIFSNTSYLTINNSIFYKSEPQGCTNCAFNNNVTFGNVNNVIPGPDNVGSGNMLGVNPQFINYPLAGGAFDYAYNFNLLPASPLISAGIDGSDIGIYGGILPFIVGLNPPIPVVQELKLPENNSSVKKGGTLNVSFKATKQ
jgi:hypothetical protein